MIFAQNPKSMHGREYKIGVYHKTRSRDRVLRKSELILSNNDNILPTQNKRKHTLETKYNIIYKLRFKGL